MHANAESQSERSSWTPSAAEPHSASSSNSNSEQPRPVSLQTVSSSRPYNHANRSNITWWDSHDERQGEHGALERQGRPWGSAGFGGADGQCQAGDGKSWRAGEPENCKAWRWAARSGKNVGNPEEESQPVLLAGRKRRRQKDGMGWYRKDWKRKESSGGFAVGRKKSKKLHVKFIETNEQIVVTSSEFAFKRQKIEEVKGYFKWSIDNESDSYFQLPEIRQRSHSLSKPVFWFCPSPPCNTTQYLSHLYANWRIPKPRWEESLILLIILWKFQLRNNSFI